MSEVIKCNISSMKTCKENFSNEKDSFSTSYKDVYKASYICHCDDPVETIYVDDTTTEEEEEVIELPEDITGYAYIYDSDIIGLMRSSLNEIYEELTNIYSDTYDYFTYFTNDFEYLEKSLSNKGGLGYIQCDDLISKINRIKKDLPEYNPDFNSFRYTGSSEIVSTPKFASAKSFFENPISFLWDKAKEVGAYVSEKGIKNSALDLNALILSTISESSSKVKSSYEYARDKFTIAGWLNSKTPIPELVIDDEDYNEVLDIYKEPMYDQLREIDNTISFSNEFLLQYKDLDAEIARITRSASSGPRNEADAQRMSIQVMEALDKAAQKYGFDDYAAYIDAKNELKDQIKFLEYLQVETEKNIEQAKYDCLMVLEDYEDYVHISDNIDSSKINFAVSTVTLSVSTSNYDSYCKKYGDVNGLDFAKCIVDNLNVTDAMSLNVDDETKNLIKLAKVSEMSEEYEIYAKNYNYLYDKYGKEQATQYLNIIEDKINEILGREKALQFLTDLKTKGEAEAADYILNELKVTGKGLFVGVENWAAGVDYTAEALGSFFGGDNPSRAHSISEYESMYLLEALQSGDYAGAFLDENYTISQGIGNMAPSILLSYINPALGMASQGISSAGNAYHGALTEGWSNSQALTYAAITGVTEVLTEKFLGGLPGLSDVKVTNAKSYMLAMIKEGNEEAVQNLFDAGLKYAIHGDTTDMDTLLEETWSSWKGGVITAGILQSPTAIRNSLQTNKINKALKNGTTTTAEITAFLAANGINVSSTNLDDAIGDNLGMLNKFLKNKTNTPTSVGTASNMNINKTGSSQNEGSNNYTNSNISNQTETNNQNINDTNVINDNVQNKVSKTEIESLGKKLKEKIKNIYEFTKAKFTDAFKSALEDVLEEDNVNVSRYDETHGYQLIYNDYIKSEIVRKNPDHFTREQIYEIISNINNEGYMSMETGEYLQSLYDDDYNVVIKTIRSGDLDSIFKNGVYCNGTSASNGNSAPTDINDVNLDHVVESRNVYIDRLITKVKTAYGNSSGSNPIDGTLILKFPKDASIEELVYKTADGIYAIDPKYIEAFVGVDENSNVAEPIKRLEYMESHNNSTANAKVENLLGLDMESSFGKDVYNLFESSLKNDNIPQSVRTIISNLGRIKELFPNFRIEQDPNNVNSVTYTTAKNQFIRLRLEDINGNVVYHELGHALLHLFGDSDANFKLLENERYNNSKEIAKNNILKQKDIITNLVKEYNDKHESVLYETATWYNDYRANEQAKMTNEINDLYARNDMTGLKDILIKAQHDIYTSKAVKQIITEANYDFYNLDGIIHDKDLMTKIAIKYNDVTNQYRHIDSVMSDFNGKGDLRKVICMISSIVEGQNITFEDGQIVLPIGHAESYYNRDSTKSYDELFADFFCLNANGRTEALNLFKSIVGEDIYNVLENQLKAIEISVSNKSVPKSSASIKPTSLNNNLEFAAVGEVNNEVSDSKSNTAISDKDIIKEVNNETTQEVGDIAYNEYNNWVNELAGLENELANLKKRHPIQYKKYFNKCIKNGMTASTPIECKFSSLEMNIGGLKAKINQLIQNSSYLYDLSSYTKSQFDGTTSLHGDKKGRISDFLYQDNESFGVDQAALEKLCTYLYNGKEYDYKQMRNIVNNAKNEGKPIPKFTLVETEKYKSFVNKLKKKGFTEKESRIILASINDAGACSYASVVNEIFFKFENNQEYFKKIFGYDMYVNVNGYNVLNGEELLLDLYLYANDMANGGTFIQTDEKGMKSLNPSAYGTTIDFEGNQILNANNQVYMSNWLGRNEPIIDSFLKSKDSNLEYKASKVISYHQETDPYDFEFMKKIFSNNLKMEMKNGKTATLGYYYDKNNPKDSVFDMKSLHPDLYPDTSTATWGEGGGHSATITEVRDDGLVVSSWGKEYLIPLYCFTAGGRFTISINDIIIPDGYDITTKINEDVLITDEVKAKIQSDKDKISRLSHTINEKTKMEANEEKPSSLSNDVNNSESNNGIQNASNSESKNINILKGNRENISNKLESLSTSLSSREYLESRLSTLTSELCLWENELEALKIMYPKEYENYYNNTIINGHTPSMSGVEGIFEEYEKNIAKAKTEHNQLSEKWKRLYK